MDTHNRKEGHPLLRIKSTRAADGINIVAFKSNVLSNVREHCCLKYSLNLINQEDTVARGEKVLMVIKK